MKRYKKRTIALILASVITVIGAFGSENYKNNLLGLKFNEKENSTDIILETQVNYEKKINLSKISSNTYVIMLPEVKEALVKIPELPRTIDKIDIKTMPYTKNSTGYTKISIKKEKLDLLYQIFSREYETKLDNGILSYVKDDKKHIVLIATHIDRINENELINLVDEFVNLDFDVIDIICQDVSQNINSNIFIDKKIVFLTKEKLYTDYFSKYSIFPDDSKIDTSITKLKFRDILKNFFLPEKARSYFFCGLILIFSSIILPYHIYYILFGSTLLIFAIVCKLLPKIKKNK